MKNRLFWGLITSLVLLMGISTSASAAGEAAERVGFTAADKEFYMTEELFFFFRPGLVLTIVDYEIPADLQPVVNFTLTDPSGQPLDMDGVFTPGDISARFFISYIPAGEEQRVNYIFGSRGPTYDHDGTFTTEKMGSYTYKYATALPADYDIDATHTIAGAARRDLRDFDLDRYSSNDWDDFVPSAASDPLPRDVVTTATCNRCHDPLGEHGGRYKEVAVCEQCHNPDLVDDEGVSHSFDVMVHRVHMELDLEDEDLGLHDEYPADINDCAVCHTGGTPTEDLPMVANPNPAEACARNGLSATTLTWINDGRVEIHLDSADGKLFAAGGDTGSAETGQWVTDGMVFVLVDTLTGEAIQEVPVNNTVLGCTNNPPGTFRGDAGMQWDRWTSRPSRDVCGSCHFEIDFATGEGHLAQTNDDNCSTCHVPYSGKEYDRSVTGAHTVTFKSDQLPGIQIDVISIATTSPGRQPLVTMAFSDKFGPLDPGTLGRIRVSLSGPNDDFDFYVQEDALGKLVQANSYWTYRFEARIPGDATGSYTFGVEARKPIVVNAGEENEFTHNDQLQNFTVPFVVTDDEPVARRLVVDDAKCENCHANLDLHGSNRHDANAYCDTCHMPGATDARVRPEGTGPAQGIHFKYMIHKIHRGSELTQTPYIVYGYRSSEHDYSNVEFPGDLRNCEACHLDGTYEIPLPDDLLPTFSPASQIELMLPTTAACLACHDSDDAAAHADANTSDSLGESCATCHGEGKTYSVERVHAH